MKESINHFTYVDTFPESNLSNRFLILKSAHETLVDDWLAFINFYIKHDIPDSSTNTKNPQVRFKEKYTIDSNEFLGAASDKVLEIFGFNGPLNVISQKNINGSHKYVAESSYKNLVNILMDYDGAKLGKLLNANTMIDRFFLYQHSNGKLLYPLSFDRQLISRNYQFKHYFVHNELLDLFSEFLETIHSNENSKGNYISSMIHMLTATKLNKLKGIQDSNLADIEKYILQNGYDNTKKGDMYLYMINIIRRLLIEKGRSDIKPPENRQGGIVTDKNDPTKFLSDVVDIAQYPNFEDIIQKAREFLLHLKNVDMLTSRTIKGEAYKVKMLIDFLIEYHPNSKIDTTLAEHIFNPTNKNNIVKYIRSKRSDSSAGGVLGSIAKFLKFSELMTPYILKHIPRIKKIKRVSARKAMPKHMLKHLTEILTQRPPQTQTVWSSDKASLDWWEHKNVYPVFPIMVLIHLFIPLRGAQIRNLCRDASFDLDELGNVQNIIVNTDKNTGRSHLQEIPNVWEQLDILSDFIKWHKVYFPNLPKVVYNDDENSPWEDITPLMITPKNYKPISEHTHMNYFKRLLVQYQIESNMKFKDEGSDKKVQIVWSKKKSMFVPKTIEELDSKPDNFFQYIASEYDIHSLRVTGATRYLEAGLGVSLVMRLTGHTSPDMLLNVYNKLKLEEKKDMLSTAVNKIFLTDGADTSNNIKNFLLDEIPNNYDTSTPEGIEQAFDDNNLFSLDRKSSSESKGGTMISKGTEIAASSHPSTWTPMVFGICPGVKCPDGRENRCSLCPYLITGRIFLDGAIHQANLKLINFYRLSKEIYEEQTVGYENSAKSERIDLLFEEVMGWFKIIKNIEDSIKSNPDNLPVLKNNDSIVGRSIETPEISYLKTNYNAIKMGVEKDNHGIAVLMIKAFQMINKEGNKELEVILKDETKTVDWLMSVYLDKKQNNMLASFIKQLS